MDIYFTLWVITQYYHYLFCFSSYSSYFCHWALLQSSFCVLLMSPLPFFKHSLIFWYPKIPQTHPAPALELSTSPRSPRFLLLKNVRNSSGC